jgi:molecular chaperone DnaK
MTKLIEKNTTIPTKAGQVFSTADDSQTAVTIHVLQGERERASDNKSLGRFDLADIPPLPRGMPQIEVTFDIDANGILNVSAKDKQTGKEQKIVIKASSGLSETEIKRMVKEAEAHAEEDKRFRELVDARNKADGLMHSTEKAVKDLGEKVSADEKQQIDGAIAALKTVINGDDKSAIEAKLEELGRVSQAVLQKAYAQAAETQGGAGAAGSAQGDAGAKSGAKEDAVDAEFEEVKDKDRKQS